VVSGVAVEFGVPVAPLGLWSEMRGYVSGFPTLDGIARSSEKQRNFRHLAIDRLRYDRDRLSRRRIDYFSIIQLHLSKLLNLELSEVFLTDFVIW